MRKTWLLFVVGGLAVFALVLGACGDDSDGDGDDPSFSVAAVDVGLKARAEMAGVDGVAMGSVDLRQTAHGVLVMARVAGLEPGGHGFHIHTTGSCSPDFSAAGDHFNPGDRGHGLDNADGFHAGDLPNLIAAADGTGAADFFTDAVTLASGPSHSVFDSDGSAVIIHDKPDTYGAEAGAGDRVACGVIERV